MIQANDLGVAARPVPPLAAQGAAGAKWVGVSTTVMALLRMAVVAALARMLEPADFGLMSMVLVVVGLAEAISDLGMSAAVIHRLDQTSEQLSTLYWSNVFVGAALFGALLAARPGVVLFYGDARLGPLLIWTSLTFLMTPFGSLQRVLLRKHLRFRQLAVIEIAAEGAASLAALGIAWRGFGVLALVAAQLIRAGVATLLLLPVKTSGFRPRLHWRRVDLRGYVRFGVYQLGATSVNYLLWNLDKVLIGRLLGAEALGFYSVAWNLMQRPMSVFNQIVNRVSLPLYAALQDQPKRVERGYLRVNEALAATNAPIYAGMAVVSSPLLLLYLGPEWRPAVPVFAALSVLGLSYSFANLLGPLLVGVGRPDVGFWMSVVALPTTIGAIALGSKGGITGVALALLVSELALFVPLRFWAASAFVNISALATARAVLPFLFAAAVMAAAVRALDFVFPVAPLIPRLALLVVVGAAVYGALVLLLRPQFLSELVALAKGRA